MQFLGDFGFLLFFLGDFNDWKFHRKWLTGAFPLGLALLVISISLQLSLERAVTHSFAIQILLLLVGAGFLFCEVICLFFSFPTQSAYMEPGEKRKVSTSGFYALCRHPGFLCLGAAMTILTLAAGLPVSALIRYNIWNLILILFEDRIVFPNVLSGYDQYRKETPFLIPSRAKKMPAKKTSGRRV